MYNNNRTSATYECKYCGRRFDRVSDRYSHETICTKANNKYKCSKCGDKFEYMFEKNRHEEDCGKPSRTAASSGNPYSGRAGSSYGSGYGTGYGNSAYGNGTYGTGYGRSSYGGASYNYGGRYSYGGGSKQVSREIDIEEASIVGKEFKLTNVHGQFNCFLNVVLQALWVFPVFRVDMKSFCSSRDGGPEELKPFINAL